MVVCHDSYSRRWCLSSLFFLVVSGVIGTCSGFVAAVEVRSGVRSTTLRWQGPSISRCPTWWTLHATAKVDITPELVRKTAGLAQIQISDEEVDGLLPRIEDFLGFVETMEEVSEPSDGTFATLSCGQDFLREDAAERFSNVAAVMENMPVEEASYLRVPKVGEDEG